MSGFVHTLLVMPIQGGQVIIKGKVSPSQKIRELPKEIWIVCQVDTGKVLGAFCTCTAGYSECCNHVITVLYKIEHANVIYQ